ncbi:hypothetical protein [Zoogloea sp.]|uniref:hypothetical protein n=1 Tax=Zoogloea sp. TaxID=49181 RepID=UPI0031FC2EAA
MTPSHPSWRFHATCCLCYTLACLAWNYWAGRDQSWDQLNYHLYVALAWWQNRLPDELFAASAQGYLNPLPHLPFFAAWSTGWHSLAIASLMAVLHSINLWLLHFIGLQLIPGQDRLQRLMLVGGVLLGGLTPAFLIEVGGSLTDVVVSIPALASLLCLGIWLKGRDSAQVPYAHPWTYLHLSGLLAGLSMGLKPSGLVFAAAMALAGILLAGRRHAWGCAWRSIVSGLAGFLLGGGTHAWMLWKHFGNPVFPLFNATFRSPWFPPVNLVADRFRPASLMDALRYPLDLVSATAKVGFEGIASDVRPIALIGLLLGAVAVTIWRTWRHQQTDARQHPITWLPALTLIAFTPAWLYTSGNTRYALPALMVIGPLIGQCAHYLSRRAPLIPMLALGLILSAQSATTFTLNTTRLDAKSWSPKWFDLELPAILRQQPAYYLSLQTQPYAFLATALPRESRMTNLVGQNTLDPAGLLWQQVQQEKAYRKLSWRSLYAVPMIINQGGVPLSAIDAQDSLLSEYGLKSDRKDCTWIVIDGSTAPPLTWTTPAPGDQYVSEPERAVVLSCPLESAAPLDSAEAERRNSIDARMDQWEKNCPRLFQPAYSSSVQHETERRRNYIGSETILSESGGKLFARTFSGNPLIPLENKQGHRLLKGCPEQLRAN